MATNKHKELLKKAERLGAARVRWNAAMTTLTERGEDGVKLMYALIADLHLEDVAQLLQETSDRGALMRAALQEVPDFRPNETLNDALSRAAKRGNPRAAELLTSYEMEEIVPSWETSPNSEKTFAFLEKFAAALYKKNDGNSGGDAN